MRTLIITFFIFLSSAPVLAKYNPEPDASAYRLGVGSLDGYGKVYYVCDTGGDDTLNNGLSTATPFKTYAKAMSLYNSLLGGEAIAFCRGGNFLMSANVTMSNANATAANRVTVRDYQPPQGSKDAPKILVAEPATGAIYGLSISGGTSGSREGVIIKNLHFIGTNKAGDGFIWAIRLSNDTDYITIDNVKMEGFTIGVNGSQMQSSTVAVADEVITDLTFTHNIGGGDTLTRAAGTWDAKAIRGAAIEIVSGSIANNGKKLRISESSGNVITLTDTTDGIWDVVNEANTANVTVKIWYNDDDRSFIDVKNVESINNSGHGLFGDFGAYSTIHDNEFSDNGWGSLDKDHNIYISHIHYADIYNNELHDNAYYQGGPCKSVSLVGHGVWDHVKIRDNLITQPENKTYGPCYGIAIDNGYNYMNESFTNLEITGNTIVNVGLGIGCNACVNVLIDNNTIYSTTTDSFVTGISVPDRDESLPDNIKTSSVTISNNKLYGKSTGTWKTNTSSIGVRAGHTADDTEGTITVENNTIDNVYNCIKNNSTGGATIAITGNATTNCTTGEQP
jgi:hypothetical protein